MSNIFPPFPLVHNNSTIFSHFSLVRLGDTLFLNTSLYIWSSVTSMPILDHKQCYHGIFRKLSREEVSTWDRKWFARLSWWLSWDENQLSPIKISLSWDIEIIITRQERNIIHSVVSNVNMTKLHNSVCRLSWPFERALEWQFCGTKSKECLLTLS